MIAYMLVAFYLQRPKERTILLLVLFAIGAAELVVGFHQFTHGDQYMPFGLIRASYGKRASGFFISSIHLAGYLEILFGFCISLALWSRWRVWARVALGYFGVLLLIGIALTGSRGGYLSTAASIVTVAALSLWMVRRASPTAFNSWLLLTLIAGILLAGSSIWLMSKSSLLGERLGMLGSQFHKPSDARIYNWQAAIDQFKTAPFLGTGAGTHIYYGRLFRRAPLQVDPVHAHSDYLEYLAEYGIAGMACMAFFLVAHLRNGIKAIPGLAEPSQDQTCDQRNRTRLGIQIGAMGAAAAYLTHSIMDFNMHIPGNALTVSIIFAILANPGIDRLPEDEATDLRLPLARFALPVLALPLLLFGLPLFPGERLTEQARVALRNRNARLGAELAEKALLKAPKNADTYLYLGEANRMIGNALRTNSSRRPFLEKAESAYLEAIRLFPQDENAWIRLGQVRDDLGSFEEAGTAYKEALRLDPKLGALYAYYAVHLLACGRDQEARTQLALGENLAKKDLLSSIDPPLDTAKIKALRDSEE